jgi:hypothetical protein
VRVLKPGQEIRAVPVESQEGEPARVDSENDVNALGDNGLTKRAPAISLPPMPAGLKPPRRATPADAGAIAALQEHYAIRKLDVSDHPKNGWLVQKSTPDAIRFAMTHYKHFWVVEDAEGKIVAFQAICAPRYISRPVQKHKLYGPFKKRALQVLSSGRFIYMSQVAVAPEYAGRGLAKIAQAHVLAHYDKRLPLVAHVAVFTQSDFDARQAGKPFLPIANNLPSHRFHHKQGYVQVGWTGDIRGSVEYNSGLTPSNDPDAPPPVVGVVWMHFRDGRENLNHPFVDPLEAVLGNGCAPGEADSKEWENAFPPTWPDMTYDMSGDWDCGFVPNFTGMLQWWESKNDNELDALLDHDSP